MQISVVSSIGYGAVVTDTPLASILINIAGIQHALLSAVAAILLLRLTPAAQLSDRQG